MSDRYIDGILAYVDGIMTQDYRDVLLLELKQLDKDIIEYRAEVEKWDRNAEKVRANPDIDPDLRNRTIARASQRKRLLISTERYRAYVVNELYNQDVYRSAHEYAN